MNKQTNKKILVIIGIGFTLVNQKKNTNFIKMEKNVILVSVYVC